MKSFSDFLDEAKQKKCPEGQVRRNGKCVDKKSTRMPRMYVLGRWGYNSDHDHADNGDNSNVIDTPGDGGGNGGGDGGGGGGE